MKPKAKDGLTKRVRVGIILYIIIGTCATRMGVSARTQTEKEDL